MGSIVARRSATTVLVLPALRSFIKLVTVEQKKEISAVVKLLVQNTPAVECVGSHYTVDIIAANRFVMKENARLAQPSLRVLVIVENRVG